MLRSTIVLAILCSQVFVSLAQSPENAHPNAASATTLSLGAFEKLKSLEGDWAAPLTGKQVGKTMVNTFHVIGEGSAVVHSEWLDGKQLTTTVFYLVGSDLRADHFCDYQNQPRYIGRPSADASVITFELRDITNLEAHPRHFHSTTWHFLDATHLTQDWQIVEAGKEPKMVRMEFTRK